jgi:translation initiation factor 1
MPTDDWKASLAALAAAMPPTDEPQPTPEATPTDKPSQQGRLDIIMEKKGRGGKTATIVSGFTIDDDSVAQVASRLKSRLATGGSSRGGEILIQGDRRREVLALLTGMGFKARVI